MAFLRRWQLMGFALVLGGAAGGKIVGKGPSETVAWNEKRHTG